MAKSEDTISKSRAIIELLTAGAMWGFGFVATIWALKDYSPIELLVFRYIVAFFVGELVWYFFISKTPKYLNPFKEKNLKEGLIGGFLLAAFMIPQTIGLLTTTAAKSAFITTLYILLVPLLAPLFHHAKTSFWNFILALVALFGTFLLTGASFEHIVVGDFWTLACAVIAAIHILYIDKISEKINDPFRFNNIQALMCLVVTLALIPTQNKVSPITFNFLPWFGILHLALFSTMIAFTIQLRAQKILPPTTASMLFLLESPFALVFGVLILSETVTTTNIIGCIFILAASALTILIKK